MKSILRSLIIFLTLFTCLLAFSPAYTAAQSGPALAGCPLFPSDSVWNTPVDQLPLDANSSLYISTIGPTRGFHPDFGSGLWDGGPIGIPYNIVGGTQPRVPISFEYDDECDPGPYPIPAHPSIEGGEQSNGDRHVLVLDQDNCLLYETWSTYPEPDGSWTAGSGAIFDLRSHALRPSGWTSSDAAGLPILPGLVRYDEVAAGEIKHALRFTAPQTRRQFIWPARHYASNLTETKYPPMGQRFRLKASKDISRFSPEVQVILRALKKYGMILADNGSAWYISGVPDPRWNNDVLVSEFRQILGSDFEAVDETSLMIDQNSGQAVQPPSDGEEDPPETVSTPWSPSGPAAGMAGTGYPYSTGGSSSNLAHALSYQFDWNGDASTHLSPWGPSSQSRTWTQPGSYLVRARARCAAHQENVSEWSQAFTVQIAAALGPDLTGSWTVPVQETCRRNRSGRRCSLTGTLTVVNRGDKEALSASVHLYLSPSSSSTNGAVLIKSTTTGTMAPGAIKTIRLDYSLPLGQSATGKYVLTFIDRANKVIESNEANNTFATGPF